MNRVPGVLILEATSGPGLSPGPSGYLEFSGDLFGAPTSAEKLLKDPDHGYGEAVFNTSMTGYQEILTDPSYYGQIVCMTYPHIGNTGINLEDPESARSWCAGFVVHELSDVASNWRSRGDLETYLKENGIPGLLGVDTRALTRFLRSQGVLRALILPVSERNQAQALFAKMPAFEGRDLIHEVSTREAYPFSKTLAAQGEAQGNVQSQIPEKLAARRKTRPVKVVAYDFGAKWNLFRMLQNLGCEVEVVPANESAEAVLARKPDGVFLSNGPGDPAAATYAHAAVKKLADSDLPMFGVCMGHQILALALGGKTYKLKFGHRGANQPILEKASGRVSITSQNHGYAVEPGSLPENVEVTHVHLNDRTVAGLAVKGRPIFSVQYHPEACPGPHDSAILFERFVEACTKNI